MDLARERHIDKMQEIKKAMGDCHKNYCHYKDLKRQYDRMSEELVVYDEYKGENK